MNHSSLTTTRKKCMESPGPKYILVHISGSNENRMNSNDDFNRQGCLRWRETQSQPVHHKVFENVNPFVLFISLFLYGFSTICFNFAQSTLFSNRMFLET